MKKKTSTNHIAENTMNGMIVFEQEILDSFIIMQPAAENLPEFSPGNIFDIPTILHNIVYPIVNTGIDQYQKYDDELETTIEMLLQKCGVARIIQCHTFLYDEEEAFKMLLPRPVVCIGTDIIHTPSYLKAFFLSQLSNIGEVMVDYYFTGAFVPPHYKSDTRVESIAVGINKSLYMDVDHKTDKAKLEHLRQDMQKVFSFA